MQRQYHRRAVLLLHLGGPDFLGEQTLLGPLFGILPETRLLFPQLLLLLFEVPAASTFGDTCAPCQGLFS